MALQMNVPSSGGAFHLNVHLRLNPGHLGVLGGGVPVAL